MNLISAQSLKDVSATIKNTYEVIDGESIIRFLETQYRASLLSPYNPNLNPIEATLERNE